MIPFNIEAWNRFLDHCSNVLINSRHFVCLTALVANPAREKKRSPQGDRFFEYVFSSICSIFNIEGIALFDRLILDAFEGAFRKGFKVIRRFG